jgi:iron complex outermembrane receptor protein
MVSVAVTPNDVLAQDGLVLEEIIVTAAKRETNLQDTPIAITAMTGDTLDAFNIQSSHDMLSSVIGLEGTISAGNLAIAIRGINSENTDVTSDPTVAFHMDGVFRGRQSGGLAAFHDVQRVETLKGPQGTLYGRNATAGSINVITNKPVHNTEGSVEVLAGSYSRLGVRGVFNTSVIEDKLAVRFSFLDEDRTGYFNNGPLIKNPYGDSVESAFRMHALITPNDRLSVLLTADSQKRGGAGDGTNQLAGVSSNLSTDLPTPHTLIQNTEGFRDDSFMTLKGEVNYSYDSVDLTYIGALYESDVDFGLDFDRGVSAADPLNIKNGSEQMSHELRLASNGDGPLEWLTGLYYLDEDASRYTSLAIARFGVKESKTSIPNYNVTSAAVFGQGIYHVSDTLRITAGLRYSDDRKSQTDTTYYRNHARFGESLTTVSNDGSWSSTDWTLGIDANPVENVMVYAKVGTGFKAGAFNVANPRFGITASTFRPEEVLAFQIGHKSSLLDNRLQWNSEMFIYDYTDLQVTQRDDDNTITKNAAEADIKGFETELTALPTDSLRVSLGVGYLDAEYGKFMMIHPISDVDTDLAGSDLVKSPRWSVNASLDYVINLANGWQINPRIRTAHRSDMKLLPFNELGSLMPARSVTDVSVDFVSADERLRFRLFGNNVSDVIVWSGAGTNGQGVRTLTGSPPSMYGASLKYSFGD